ncbi:MAG: MFS transporter [Ktedonobacteraceae bacterium]|nr:MFS transporter [Ktedonobacteraceae bacterium]
MEKKQNRQGRDYMKPVSQKYNSQFLLLWFGQTASIFGDRVTGLALPWLLLQQTHSTFDAGIITALRYLPLIALGLMAGLVVDRLNRRLVLIICDVARAGILSLIVLLGVFQLTPPLWLLAGVVLVLGTGQLFFQTAYSAWLPDIIQEEAFSNANAALEASDAASTLAGPLFGGIIIQTFGAVLSLGTDAISYIISALILLCVRNTAPSVRNEEKTQEQKMTLSQLWSEALEGVHFILSTPAQRLLKGIGTVLYLSSGSIELLLATLTQVRLHLPAWQAGFVFGAAGVGGLIGSALAPSFYRRGWRSGITASFLLGALAAVGLAYTGLLHTPGSFVLALISNLLLDGAVSFGFILTTTESVLATPREIRGRVNAASNMYASLIRGGSVLLVGIIAASGETALAFICIACCFIAGAVLSRVSSV